MTNEENTVDVATTQDDDVELELDDESGDELEGEEEVESKKDDKPTETPEQKVARLRRQLSREEKKLGKTESKPQTKQDKSSGELDYGQLAYLTAKGIENDDEIELITKVMKDTGKSLKDVVANKYVKADLEELRESRKSSEVVSATTKTGRRASQSNPGDVDYWLKKPFSEVPADMRAKVLNARLDKAKNDSKFASNSVIIS